MFWAKTSPAPVAATDFGVISPVSTFTRRRRRRPEGTSLAAVWADPARARDGDPWDRRTDPVAAPRAPVWAAPWRAPGGFAFVPVGEHAGAAASRAASTTARIRGLTAPILPAPPPRSERIGARRGGSLRELDGPVPEDPRGVRPEVLVRQPGHQVGPLPRVVVQGGPRLRRPCGRAGRRRRGPGGRRSTSNPLVPQVAGVPRRHPEREAVRGTGVAFRVGGGAAAAVQFAHHALGP